MSAWPGKFVIGLTGNIATGKSVVRKMLEHLGAYGIDADALAHRAIASDAPGYQPVVETFGTWILGPDRQIDRGRLGRIVFADPQALAALEAIIHPLVRQAIDALVRRTRQNVIVIEAIKLLEGPLKAACDTIFVTYAPAEVQVARLVQKRGLSVEVARQRVNSQPSQDEKLAVANVVIRNTASYEHTWRQVVAAWQALFPGQEARPLRPPTATRGEMVVERARPRQAGEIAAFITRITANQKKMSREDVMAAFGEKAFLLLKMDGKLIGLAGWQVENLVARTDEVYLEPNLDPARALRLIIEEVEKASRDLLCEASLLFLPASLARRDEIWRSLGYEARSIESLGVRAWQEAAQESMPAGTVLLFKQLRKDRVLHPV